MKTVMAQGTFDILHPGHIHYLEKSAELGDELVVVLARDSRVKEKKGTYFSEAERLEMVEALEVVDDAVYGSQCDIYTTVRKVDPDVITLGYDQDFDVEHVKEMAEKVVDHEVEVVRIGEKKGYSSSDVRAFSG